MNISKVLLQDIFPQYSSNSFKVVTVQCGEVTMATLKQSIKEPEEKLRRTNIVLVLLKLKRFQK